MAKRSKQDVVKKKSRFAATIRDATGDQAKLKIGEILKKEGYITGVQLNEANAIFKKEGGFISSILLSKRYIEGNTIYLRVYRRSWSALPVTWQGSAKPVFLLHHRSVF